MVPKVSFSSKFVLNEGGAKQFFILYKGLNPIFGKY